MELKIYPKINQSLEGLDKFRNVIKEYHGCEAQYLCKKGELEYIDFYTSVKEIIQNCNDIKELTIHPPLPIYDLELLFLKDETIVYREIEDCIRISKELDIDINLLYHTTLNYISFIGSMKDKMLKMLDMVKDTRVTILLENIFYVDDDPLMHVLEIVRYFDNEHLKVCFDLCHAYCKAHIMKKDNIEFFDEYLNKELCEKYVKQVHFSYTREFDGYVKDYTHGRKHDSMDNLIYDLEILKRYGMIDKNIVTEVNEDDKNYVERCDQLSDIKMLYEYMNKEFPRIDKTQNNKENIQNVKAYGGNMYKRILMKLSGEALSGKQGFGFDDDNAKNIVRQIKELINMNVELGLVIGGGNIWRGRENTDMDMSKSHQIGIMATVINAMYMQEILRGAGIKARVITPFEISGMTDMFEKTKVNDYLEKGEVCIFAGGIGQPFFTTDTGAVLNALKINADALFLAKNVDGVYDKDPKKFSDAIKYNKVTFNEVLDKKLGVMDLTAVILCMENNMNVVVFDLNTEGNIMKNVKGEITGTLVVNE